jgi:hypothetical protein
VWGILVGKPLMIRLKGKGTYGMAVMTLMSLVWNPTISEVSFFTSLEIRGLVRPRLTRLVENLSEMHYCLCHTRHLYGPWSRDEELILTQPQLPLVGDSELGTIRCSTEETHLLLLLNDNVRCD